MEFLSSNTFFTLSLFLLFTTALSARPDESQTMRRHTFTVERTPVKRLCQTKNVLTVNGTLPGPTLEVFTNDTLEITVINKADENVTIHWHGVRQLRTAWSDGPEFVTQCPIRPGMRYTYRFTVPNQEGTLWWHAHSSWIRATVYGALIIYPKPGVYPFRKPVVEIPIIMGEWWNADPLAVVRSATSSGGAPNVSDAYTINGQPGDFYNCSSQDTAVFHINSGETSLLRVINAALNQELFFAVANHTLTVVGADASYLKPFNTNLLVLGPGQTTDVLLKADQTPSRYYIAASPYASAQNAAFNPSTTTAILSYNRSNSTPIPASLPSSNDTNSVTLFTSRFRSRTNVNLSKNVDESLFFTVGLGVENCGANVSPSRCQGPLNGTRFSASMNNVSFVLPSNYSLLQAHYHGVRGVFSVDFPGSPLPVFNFTGNVPQGLWAPVKATRLYKLKYGSLVQIVLQGTNIVTFENHPIHLHGYDFYIIGQGFGNYDANSDPKNFNFVNPPLRNTVLVPVNGWAAIQFVADNPGVWLMHCHLDVHITWGLAMAFLVENGIGDLQSLEAPPLDLPVC